jgi:aspartyl-tRNA(Asn)/glutamyl-tRNA(Gln) amidotransferase subunit A
MSDLAAWEIAERVRNKEVSAREVIDETLKRMDGANVALNAFTVIDRRGARKQADAIDEAIARGEDPGPLAGVPIGVKDLEPAAGLPWTSGSKAFASRVAKVDSVQVARLRAAGAVVMGKTNTPEFGYKGFTDNLLYGPTRNPWDPSKTSGGSSGGSASAVAGGLVPLCTASDGGGSIRIPSAFCGVYGIKPNAGRIPRAGENAPGWGVLSQVGPIARTVRDAARYLDATAGPHPNDLESLDAAPGGYEEAALGGRPTIRRVAWSGDLGYAVVDPDVQRCAAEAARLLADALGAELVEASPGFDNPIQSWLAIAAPGDTLIVDDVTPAQREQFERGFVQFAELGRQVSGLDIARAQEARHHLNRRMTAFFEEYDLLLTPTTATTAFGVESGPPTVIAGQEVGPAAFLPFTYPFNFTGHPAASVPAGFAPDGLPVGLQIVAPRFAEKLLLAVSATYEAANPFRFPPEPRRAKAAAPA